MKDRKNSSLLSCLEKFQRLFFVALLSVLAVGAFAQSKTVSGTVLDKTGESVIGASVVVKGTTNGTITDIDGRFTLVVSEKASLVFSYIGYLTQEMLVGKKTFLNVQLQEDNKTLDEVVITGYGGTQLRSKMTNSIAKVDNSTLSTGAHTNPAQALSGAVAGLRVQQTSGNPNSTPTLVLRGGTNLDGSGSPLVIIDGAVRESLSDVNPEDIESLEVMKDAGATAIYGARASNGVILVTTKRGSEGHTEINLSAKVGFNFFHSQYEFLNAHDYLYYMRSAFYRSSHIWQDKSGAWHGFASDATLSGTQPYGTGNRYFDEKGNVLNGNKDNTAVWGVMNYTNDLAFLLKQGWQTMDDPVNPGQKLIYCDNQLKDYNIKSPAITQDYNLSVSGGNDKGHYYVVVGEEAEAVYVADGELKLLARPKRKNRRHIQPIRKLPADVAELLQNQMDDVVIKRAIKLYKKHVEK